MQKFRTSIDTARITLAAALTAIVVVLQFLGQFIKLGPFAISPVLIPIVIGAALCGPGIGAWLGLSFSVVVLFTDAAAFFAVSPMGTVVTVLLKGMLAGLAAGVVYKLIAPKNVYVATLAAAIVCPIVNTGVFLLGCFAFFYETLAEWGRALGFEGAVDYMFLGLAGGNFLFELITNIVLSPVAVRILRISKRFR